jgi:hypothetical protein
MRRSLTALVVVLLVVISSLPSLAAATCNPGDKLCRFRVRSTTEISREAGLGRVEIHDDVAAVLQRDEGIVTLVDVSHPDRPRVTARYSDDAQDSLDGDIAFSHDGEWIFYARQTEQFSRDGTHVLHVSDPETVSLASYQPGGGAYRVAYLKQGAAEWVYVLDAIDGLVVSRFIREAGVLVRVNQDPLPALKVGGPASAGITIDPKDPATGKPLMYVTTGRTGLQIYDLSDPAAPALVGGWDAEPGLAEVEVRATKGSRLVYAASEYWFNKQLPPAIYVLDATKLGAVKKVDVWSVGAPADDHWRIQGMATSPEGLLVAHSQGGLIRFSHGGRVEGVASIGRAPNKGSGAIGTPYAFDVETSGGSIFLTDASSGVLSVLR